MVYDADRDSAVARVKALALRVLRERLESGESVPEALEALEDEALMRAIQDGEGLAAVSRDEVFRALDGGSEDA